MITAEQMYQSTLTSLASGLGAVIQEIHQASTEGKFFIEIEYHRLSSNQRGFLKKNGFKVVSRDDITVINWRVK